MGEDGLRLLISGSCTISASRRIASANGSANERGFEGAVGRLARKNAKTRLEMDAHSGTTLRQPFAPLMKKSLAPSFTLISCSCMLNAASGRKTSFESPCMISTGCTIRDNKFGDALSQLASRRQPKWETMTRLNGG